jgi:hypothetical protein
MKLEVKEAQRRKRGNLTVNGNEIKLAKPSTLVVEEDSMK